jgi:type II secretory pathway component PulC
MQVLGLAQKAQILGGVPVWGTVRGSAADQVGLVQGDILLRVNGVNLQSFDEFADAFRRLVQSIEFDVLRRESLVRIVVPAQAATSEWIDELGRQVFGRLS